jgi:transcriptional regulator with XRE-family HTH domain
MFSKRFKQLREEMNITQRELAEHLNCSKSAIALYETGQRNPDHETLNKIADFFSVSTDYLLGRTDFRTSADRITEALGADKELLEFWEETKDRENVQLLFKQVRQLSDKDIKQVIKIIKAIEDEEANE